MISLRCSRLPGLFACPSSHLPCEHPTRSDSQPAKLGRDVHALLARHVMGEEVEEPEDGELAMLFAFGQQAWETVKGEFPDPHVEAADDYSGNKEAYMAGAGDGWLLSGHVDVFSLGNVLDWKSGRKESDYTPQMKGYGLLFGAKDAAIVWLRDRKIQNFHVSDHAAIEREITQKVSQIGKVWNPGEHCFHCDHINGCAEYAKWARSTVSPFLPAVQKPQQPGAAAQGAPDLPTTDAGRWAFHDAARHVKQIIARGDVLLKSYLQANGPMRSADGRVMTYDEEETAGPIDPEKAWPHLIARFDQKEMQKFVVLHKGNLEAAVKALVRKERAGFKRAIEDTNDEQARAVIKAKMPGIGAAWYAFKDELREAGALTKTVGRRLQVKRTD